MPGARREGALLLALGCAPFAIGAVIAPDGIAQLPPCSFQALTGLPCPFCGGTRAFAWAARGDLAYNGFWVLVAVALILAGVLVLVTGVRVIEPLTRTPPRAIGLVLALGAGGWAWALAERATIVA